jgi:hypothetical protein
VDSGSDTINEGPLGSGTDLVRVSITRVPSTVTGTGNSSGNIITGNTSENALSGSGGDDTLDCDEGADTITDFAGHGPPAGDSFVAGLLITRRITRLVAQLVQRPTPLRHSPFLVTAERLQLASFVGKRLRHALLDWQRGRLQPPCLPIEQVRLEEAGSLQFDLALGRPRQELGVPGPIKLELQRLDPYSDFGNALVAADRQAEPVLICVARYPCLASY